MCPDLTFGVRVTEIVCYSTLFGQTCGRRHVRGKSYVHRPEGRIPA
ncbi:unnamed protein product, partial [marine sediment metagenome]